eukprot:TRINITY_DN28618_c0_g1_i3.p1 TRINITY_DN28618_c0_g1~~TRINITY_DN28618_c0_g1_i3.p1  ORF type:complete len:407 (+),score=48.78 TRINITY_DN28618_c0_g1_i3:54-1274(+)
MARHSTQTLGARQAAIVVLAFTCGILIGSVVICPYTAGNLDFDVSSILSFDEDRLTNEPSSSGLRGSSQLRVAFAVFATDISSDAWSDALEVLAYALDKAKKKSRHRITKLILGPERMKDSTAQALLGLGFDEVVRKPIPVPAKEVEREFAREHMERVQGSDPRFQFQMAEETIKYWGLAFTQYDRVLVMDADMLIVDPMDELMERPEDFIDVYDHGLDLEGNTVPPAQGGFLLVRPNETDFNAIKDYTREGDWGGSGWKHSGIGYCYGGVGPDGLLAYYYSKGALQELRRIGKKNLPEGVNVPAVKGSRWLAVDRAVYDVVVMPRLRKELELLDHDKVLSGVKSIHYTGECVKPWGCFEEHSPERWFCRGLLEIWWRYRAEIEEMRGLPPSKRGCIGGKYVAMRK